MQCPRNSECSKKQHRLQMSWWKLARSEKNKGKNKLCFVSKKRFKKNNNVNKQSMNMATNSVSIGNVVVCRSPHLPYDSYKLWFLLPNWIRLLFFNCLIYVAVRRKLQFMRCKLIPLNYNLVFLVVFRIAICNFHHANKQFYSNTDIREK